MLRVLIYCMRTVFSWLMQLLGPPEKKTQLITEREVQLEKIATYFRRMKQLADEAKDFKHALDYFAAEQHYLDQAGRLSRAERAVSRLYLNLCNAGRNFMLPIYWLIYLIVSSGTIVASGSWVPLLFWGGIAIWGLLTYTQHNARYSLTCWLIIGCGLFVLAFLLCADMGFLAIVNKLGNAIAYTALNAVSFTQALPLLDGTIDGLQRDFPPPFNNQPGEYASFAILFSKTISVIGLILIFLTLLCIRNFLRLK